MSAIEEAWEAAKQRISDAFLGTFSLAFIGIHWRFFFVLIAGEGSATKTIEVALRYAPTVWGVLGALAIAAAYTFGWLWVAGWIRTGRRYIALQEENRTRELEAEHQLETARTLSNRPEWTELTRRNTDLFAELERLWRLEVAEANQPKHGPTRQPLPANLEPLPLRYPIQSSDIPCLIAPHPAGSWTPHRTNAPHADARLAVRLIGTTTVLAVRSIGMVPWEWSDEKWLRFEDGKPVPSEQEPSGRARIVKHAPQWGLFYGDGG